jgi:hypothetical protein
VSIEGIDAAGIHHTIVCGCGRIGDWGGPKSKSKEDKIHKRVDLERENRGSITTWYVSRHGLGTVVVLVNYRGKRRKKAEKGGRKARKAGKKERGESRTSTSFPFANRVHIKLSCYVTDVTSAILTEVFYIQHQAKLRYYFVQR